MRVDSMQKMINRKAPTITMTMPKRRQTEMNIVFAYIRKKTTLTMGFIKKIFINAPTHLYNDLFKFDFWSHFYDFQFRTFGILIYKVFRRALGYVYERAQ